MGDTATAPRHAADALRPVPLVVIGGYLGTGKTTLVNHLLCEAAGRRVTILVNDFGSVSIDADLIEGASDGVRALAGGCACCSFSVDLMGTLQQAARRDPPRGLRSLECRGADLPAAVVRSAALAAEAHVESVVVVVDPAQVPRVAFARFVCDTVCEQVRQIGPPMIPNQHDHGKSRTMPGVRA